MEYYSNRWCISAPELIDGGIMSASNYKQMQARGRFETVRRGGGSTGSYALIAVDSLPTRFKEKVKEAYPDSKSAKVKAWIMSNYEYDQGAVAYYFDREKTGMDLPVEKAKEYAVNASVLNTCIKLYERAKTSQRLFGSRYDWNSMATVIESLRKELGHTLPASVLRFRKKVNEYKEYGYGSLISGKFGNQSARKVDYKTERLILSIAVQPNQPWNTTVHEMYISFVCGELDVWDLDTGELFDPDDFTDKEGNPKELSEATISNYLNKPKNRVLIAKKLNSYTTFMHEQMPHMHRHAPEFSLSKVSFDDRDLPRKLKDTKQRPKAYYAYDVATGVVVGRAYNRSKTVDIVVECFRGMFRLLDTNGWGCPAQVEVENHLMSQWRDSFLKAGVMFPFVRFCAPMNSQEKYAEPLNGAKKRSIEHKNHLGIGRHNAKNRTYRTESKKVFDERNDTYEDKEYYSWEELIADDIADVEEWNHSPHPNQKKYPGMSRWEVFVANLNPTLQPVNKAVLARYVGEHVSTTIRRNSYCRVSGEDWWLSRTEVIEKLAPNNWKVEAYYLPDEEGKPTDVFIYQNDQLIDQLQNIGTYNTADCEQTDEDREIFVEQRKRIAGFNRWVDERMIGGVGIMPTAKPPATVGIMPTAQPPATVDYANDTEAESPRSMEPEDYAAAALADL